MNIIKSRLGDLKNEIEDMSNEEREIENPNEIVDISLSLIIKPKDEWG